MIASRFYTGLKQLASGREIVVYGTGRNTYLCLGEILKNCDITFFVSNNENIANNFCNYPHLYVEEGDSKKKGGANT